MRNDDTGLGAGDSAFPDTPWSRILRAGGAGSGAPEVRADWERLCGRYWRPVYMHIRRKWRRSSEDAKDLAQGFFVHVLQTGFLGKADPGQGRFRGFLRASLENYLRDAEKAAHRVVRGGDRPPVSLDALGVSEAESLLPSLADAGEDRVFDLEWRRGLLTRALAHVREAYAAEGRPLYYEALERKDLAETGETLSYEELARGLGLTADTLRNYLHHARLRLRQAIVGQIREYVANEAEVQEELRALFE